MKRLDNTIVARKAPQWAWDIIDETLEADARSKAFDRQLREDIADARRAMEPTLTVLWGKG